MGCFIRIFLCLCLCVFHLPSFSSSHVCHPHESSALLHFITSLIVNPTIYDNHYYFPTCPDVYPKTKTWENGIDCCLWSGVTCDSMSGHVIGLDLSCSALEGKVHPNSTLFHLTHLQTLNLAFNYFDGSQLPSQIGELVSLTHLNLSECGFEGDIPYQISHLSKLQSLDLSSSYHPYTLKWKETSWKRLLQNATGLREILLDQTDMSSIGLTTSPFSYSLVTLSLVHTQLSGNLTSHILCLPNLQNLYLGSNSDIEVHVPNLNCNTCVLSILDLSSCGIQGPIPSSFFNLTYLTFLNLANNDLNGSILSSISNLQHLTHLDLSFNEFTGLIPSSLSKLQHLTHLDLLENEFTGLIPSSLSNLHHLVYLDLSSNKLTGQIPNVFETLPNLQALFLWSNNLQGKLPSSLFTLTRLSQLDCSYNQIEGPLPDQVAFSNLTYLSLRDNLLNGTIPWWALSFKSLRSLYLSNNRFTGHINSEITSYSLEYLYLCGNKLEGHFPESIFNLVNLTGLCLSSNNWSGTIHFSLFSKLQNLKYLSLSGYTSLLLESEMGVNYTFSNLDSLQLLFNNIIGYSKFLGKFPVLTNFELTNNKLEGKVPKWIHDIHSLMYLNLSHNEFTSIGHLFPWYQLVILDLSFNLMDDDISSFFCNVTSLSLINLSHNRFRGTFPQCLANSSFSGDLDLQMNKLHGNLPDAFKNLQFETLNLNGNKFGGLLPKSLSNCTDLLDLNLGNNQFEDAFPNWLQNLSNLKILVLRGNKLYGPVANLKSQNMFPSLIVFDISCNNLSGSLPKAYIQKFQAMKIQRSFYSYLDSHIFSGRYGIHPEYDNSLSAITKGVSTSFEKVREDFLIIDLSENKFEGEIPDVIGELQELISLNLSHNRLVGHIPNSLGNLTNLESLDLSSNMLTGEIPAELTSLNFLEVLNLSQNQLVGPIPRGRQIDTFPNNSYEGNMGLCGFPLSLQCNNNVPQQQYPSSEAQDKFGFGWKPVAIGYACGMVLGICLGWCVFWIGKPEWLVIIFGGTTTRIKRRSRGNRRARTNS